MGAKVRVNWGSLPEGDAVELHVVINTAHRSIYVLAPDAATAMRIAHSANHVHGTTRIMAENYDRLVERIGFIPEQFKSVLPELKSAVSRRLQGTLHVDNGKLAVGNELIET